MLFEKNKINIGRQHEVDLSRGFAALLIIICHVGLYLGNPSNVGLYVFSDIIGSEFGAPVFMSLMGLSIIYSKHQDSKMLFIRGIKLFLGGYLLSIVRTLIPLLIYGNIDEWTSIDSFFVVDILQFAGLSFMLIALFKKIKLPSWAILIVSLIMVIIDQIFISMPNPIVENVWVGYFLNLFIPVNEWSCFPLLTWFFFPAFGMCLGEMLIRCKNKKLLYCILLPISFCAVVFLYMQLIIRYPDYTSYYFGNNFYYMGIFNVLINALFITFSLSCCYFLNKILPNFIQKFLTFLSTNLNVFYISTWVYISILIHLSARFNIIYNFPSIIIIMVVLVFVCYFTTKAYLLFLKKIKTNKNSINEK